MKFTPIHRFRPQIQELNGGNLDPTKPQFNQDDNGFGPQRYIALQDNKKDIKNGYNPQFAVSSPPPPTPATTNENRIFIGDTALGSQYGVSYQDELPTSFLSPNEIDNSSTSFGSGVNNLITPFY